MKTLVAGAATWLATLALAQTAAAASGVTLAPTTGHPSTAVAVSGTGFAASEAVDVYVDTVDTALLVSSSTGTLVGSVTIPASAQPGPHYVTAIGRKSGDAAQGRFAVTTPWLAYGFGIARRGWNPYENTISPGNANQLGELWRAGANGGGATPTVANGRVYISTLAGLQARSTANGALLWTQLASQSFYTSPTILGLSIYIGSSSSSPATFYALNSATGATRWSQTVSGNVFSSAAVANGVVYAATIYGSVYAFQASSGAVLWTTAIGGGNEIDSSPVIVDGVLYVGSYDDHLYALNATTGAVLWSYATGNIVESSPAVVGGVVYFGSDDDNVYALNATSGSLLWKATTNGEAYESPAVANGMVIFGNVGGTVYAFDEVSGAQVWSAALGGGVSSAAVVVANGIVYACARNNGTLHMLNEYTGAALASFGAGCPFLGSPTVSDGVVYMNTSGGAAYALAPLAQTQARAGGPPLPSSLHPDFSLRPMR